MKEQNNPCPPRRSNADYRWTKARSLAFLKALVATLSVAAAARSVGMSRQSAYRLRARLGPQFGQLWDDGLAMGLTMRRAARPAIRAVVGRWPGDGPDDAPRGQRRRHRPATR